MIIRIDVTTHNGAPPSSPLGAEFDEMGGGIGRAEGNNLVLADQDRFISRTHATVEYRTGRYILRDQGRAMPVLINGQALGHGRERAIGNGDELEIGPYRMRVIDLGNRSVPTSPQAIDDSAATDDPLALFARPTGRSSPFQDLIAPAPDVAGRPADAGAALMADPFAVPGRLDNDAMRAGSGRAGAMAEPPYAPGRPHLPDDLDLGLGPSPTNQSVDDLFGLARSSTATPSFAPGSPLAEASGAGSAGSNVDPLALFGGPVSKRAAAPQRNDTPELQGAFHPPEARPDPAMAWSDARRDAGRPAVSGPLQAAIAPLPVGTTAAAVSAQDAALDPLSYFGAEPTPRDPSGVEVFSPAFLREVPVQPHTPEGPSFAAQPVSASAPTPAAEVAAVDVASVELLAAFLHGAGVPDLQIPGGLNVQTMNTLGQIVREATQGTLDMLLARATIKREVRADMTLIAARENNPLKFSPNVEIALAHLLAPQVRGFMPPLAAMKDAYDDLRSHQFAFVAGMRAALAGVLQRFNPQQLERRLTQKSMVDSLLPMNRRAKLWDLFHSLHGEISKEAEDDFHALFGKEFLRAYEQQLERLGREEKGNEH